MEYMKDKSTEELKKEVKDLIKVNNSNFVEHQKVEFELRDVIRNNKKEILELRTKAEECTCSKYNKSMDLVVEYAQKNGVIWKEKISSLRADKFKLQDEIDELEINARSDHDNLMKVSKENTCLKENIKILEKNLVDAEKLSNEDQVKDLTIQMDMFKQKNVDLEDELETKKLEIFELGEAFEKRKEDTKICLEEELKSLSEKDDDLKALVKDLKTELESKENQKKQRMEMLGKEQIIFKSNRSKFEDLTHSIYRLKHERKSTPRCYHGTKCRRLFCKFDHTHFFRKDNRTNMFTEETSHPKPHFNILCEQCGIVCDSSNELYIHIQRTHKELSGSEVTTVKSNFGDNIQLKKYGTTSQDQENIFENSFEGDFEKNESDEESNSSSVSSEEVSDTDDTDSESGGSSMSV